MDPKDEKKYLQENANTLMAHLRPLSTFLNDNEINEICINGPEIVFTESRAGWIEHHIPEITEAWANDLLNLAANFNGVSPQSIQSLAATVPSGERLHQLRAPRIADGKISITMRRASEQVWTLEELSDKGIFSEVVVAQSTLINPEERALIEKSLSVEDKDLLETLRKGDYINFLRKAVLLKKNIVISGSTGSGKTTFTNALISCIPADERIITAEDTPEIRLPHIKQHVQLFYNKNTPGSVKAVFEDTLRMYPSRVLPAELRGDEAYFFINNVLNSGHPGTVTTIHSNSSKLAYQRMALMIQSSPEGAALNIESIRTMLYSLIDVVVQMNLLSNPRRRVVREIYFDPAYAIKQMG